MTVLNTGGEAASVTDVGLLDTKGAILISVARSRKEGFDIDGPALPTRVEAHGALSWTLPPDVAKQAVGTTFVGYGQRYRPLHWWLPFRRSPFKFAKDTTPGKMGT